MRRGGTAGAPARPDALTGITISLTVGRFFCPPSLPSPPLSPSGLLNAQRRGERQAHFHTNGVRACSPGTRWNCKYFIFPREPLGRYPLSSALPHADSPHLHLSAGLIQIRHATDEKNKHRPTTTKTFSKVTLPPKQRRGGGTLGLKSHGGRAHRVELKKFRLVSISGFERPDLLSYSRVSAALGWKSSAIDFLCGICQKYC